MAAAAFPGRLVLAALACAAVLLGLLWVPVLKDRLIAFLSRNAPRAAPRIFFLGLGILTLGLAIRARILDIVGTSLIGLLVLGLILDNY